MSASRRGFGSMLSALTVVALAAGCAAHSPTVGVVPGREAPQHRRQRASGRSGQGSLVIVGRIVTMDEPPIAEALFIEDGIVTAVGTRDEVLALAGDQVPVMDIGAERGVPRIHRCPRPLDRGPRVLRHRHQPAEAMDAALSRGWTSISEQWVNPERLDELESLAAEDALPIRVDAYLALNFGDEFLGDWYDDHERGPVGDHLRVQGLKIHLDNGEGTVINWEPADLTATIGRANEAGWQVSVHSVSTEAQEMVLDAYEAALGPTGPNPLHHRIDHAIEVSDEQLARMVAMDLATVIHTDGGGGDWVLWSEYMGHGNPDTRAEGPPG